MYKPTTSKAVPIITMPQKLLRYKACNTTANQAISFTSSYTKVLKSVVPIIKVSG